MSFGHWRVRVKDDRWYFIKLGAYSSDFWGNIKEWARIFSSLKMAFEDWGDFETGHPTRPPWEEWP